MDIVTNITKLRIRSEEVSEEEAKSIIKDLEETLKKYPTGLGLSAIQIDINKQVAIIRVKELRLDLINTYILKKDNKFRMRNEMCLSLPGLKIDTIRYNTIKINNHGKEETYHGIISVAIQHEINHFQGRTILDFKWKKR